MVIVNEVQFVHLVFLNEFRQNKQQMIPKRFGAHIFVLLEEVLKWT